MIEWPNLAAGHDLDIFRDNARWFEANIDAIARALGYGPDAELHLEDILARAEALVRLAERLIRLDDPSDPDGVEDRRTITLANLIDQAKAALGESP